MYRSDLKARDKSGAIAAAVAVHAALALMLLHLSGKMPLPDVQSALKVFQLQTPPPPPPPPIVQRPPKTEQKTRGAAAPKNLQSKATPIKRPPPVPLPVPVPIAAARNPNTGLASTQGASTPGTGTGAGGTGAGNGSGSGGNGTGGGGDGGVAEPPHLATAVLNGRDFPSSLLEQWPGGATVFLRLRVNPQGYVSECAVDRGTGVISIDAMICDLARQRLRFRPALNRVGQPVAGWFGYAQPAPR